MTTKELYQLNIEFQDKELFKLFKDSWWDLREYILIRTFIDLKISFEDKIFGIYPVIQLNPLRDVLRCYKQE